MCFGDERKWQRENSDADHADIRRLFDRYRAYARRMPRQFEDDEPLVTFEAERPDHDREPVAH